MQVLTAMLDYGADPQTAVDLPRFCIDEGGLALEEGLPAGTPAALRARGHAVSADAVSGYARSLFGRAQVIYRDRGTGVLWGGSDGRGDGCAMGF